MDETKIVSPLYVAIAEVALWELLFTQKGDYLFQVGNRPRSFRHDFLAIEKTARSGSQASGETVIVEFREPATSSFAVIGLSPDMRNKWISTWRPNSFRCDITLSRKEGMVQIGPTERIVVPVTVLK